MPPTPTPQKIKPQKHPPHLRPIPQSLPHRLKRVPICLLHRLLVARHGFPERASRAKLEENWWWGWNLYDGWSQRKDTENTKTSVFLFYEGDEFYFYFCYFLFSQLVFTCKLSLAQPSTWQKRYYKWWVDDFEPLIVGDLVCFQEA